MIKGLIAPILSPFNDDLSFNQTSITRLPQTFWKQAVPAWLRSAPPAGAVCQRC